MRQVWILAWKVAGVILCMLCAGPSHASLAALERGWEQPPPSARPWVYWFWMDGNLSREGITADLEAMHRAGIGGVIIMEVDVGIPKGPIHFMSRPWRELFKHVAAEAARLGIEIDLNASPGWTGSGGPWIKPEQSMQQVVFSETNLAGPQRFSGSLALPPAREGFYRDIAVLAFPTPIGDFRLPDIKEKALYARGHYSSEAGVRPYIPGPAQEPALPKEQVISSRGVVDLSTHCDTNGRLAWQVPPGNWTVLRLGRTSTGANTRPAPAPGLGLECDKLDPDALDTHFQEFLGKLLGDVGPLAGRSWVSLHIDSWEMGPQNWTAKFRQEFQRRRGYDPLRYLPVFTGRVVNSVEISERFLWDLRQTVSDLIVTNYAAHLGALAHQRGLRLSIQPYDGTPCDDLTYGACADVPMCEFWGNCFETFFSCTEAVSIAHVYGKPIVAAEAFTSDDKERWLFHPGSMKALGDWAFCEGINRFVFHRYAHQPWLDRWPGMTMGPYGAHYERTQTWWEQATAWHAYLSRCQYLLQQGVSVADICYLAPEGAPQVFRAPASATYGAPPARRGYNFDACTPEALLSRMSVRGGRLTLPDGGSYRLLVLPKLETMTPQLLRQIKRLVEAGATVVGPRPVKSPSLDGYPQCDIEIRALAKTLWGAAETPPAITKRRCGKGQVIWGGPVAPQRTPPTRDPLQQAKWIWHPEGNPAASAPVATRYFRRSLTIPSQLAVAAAEAVMTADNSFELWVNGHSAGSGNNFTRRVVMDITRWLKPGTNVLAVAAANGGDKPNPAGLIGAVVVHGRDGQQLEWVTDQSWDTASGAPEDWTTAESPGGNWVRALDLGPLGMAPWGALARPSAAPELFPHYDAIAGLLEQLGVPPDFAGSENLRYTHRRQEEADIYLVSNPDDRWVGANCAFRVSGKVPVIWDPVTGQRQGAAAFEEKNGRTFVPLWFEPSGSRFVIFRPPGAGLPRAARGAVVAASRDGKALLPERANPLSTPPELELWQEPGGKLRALAWSPGQYELKTAAGRTRRFEVSSDPPVMDIKGPWQVRFQPGRGAPEMLTLDTLIDWSKHPDPGVKYFSGTGTYTLSFTAPAGLLDKNRQLFLDLGKVQVMAQVRLNGRDLGILWKTPFRVDVTKAVKPGPNTLEVRVVNLWPNRLIGDSGLPPEKRIAWTTWNPFRRDSALLESGLLGPVRLVTAQVIRISN